MSAPTELRTPYTKRVELVTETIKAHSKLKDDAARELAVHVLRVLNSIPEQMR